MKFNKLFIVAASVFVLFAQGPAYAEIPVVDLQGEIQETINSINTTNDSGKPFTAEVVAQLKELNQQLALIIKNQRISDDTKSGE